MFDFFFFERVYNVFWFLSEKVDSYVFCKDYQKEFVILSLRYR